MKKLILFLTAAVLLIASCQKSINPKTEVANKEASVVKIVYNTEATASEWQQTLNERFHGAVPSIYNRDFSAFKGKKALRARIKVGFAPLIDSCCTFGAVGEVRNDTTVHMEYTQIKPLQEGETFEWIDLLMFPPNNLPPVIVAIAYVHGGNWFTDPIVFDHVPDLGVGQYKFRLAGDVLPTLRNIGSNDIVVQLN